MRNSSDLTRELQFVWRGGTVYAGLGLSMTCAWAGSLSILVAHMSPESPGRPSISEAVLWAGAVTIPGFFFLGGLFVGLTRSRIPLAAFLWGYLIVILSGFFKTLSGPRILWLFYAIGVAANIFALRVVHGINLRAVVAEQRRRYETIMGGSAYGYSFGVFVLAEIASAALIVALVPRISDAIGYDYSAQNRLTQALPGAILLMLLIVTPFKRLVDRCSRAPMVGLLVGEFVVAAIVLVFDFVRASSIDPLVYPPMVLAIGGLIVLFSPGMTTYLKQKAASLPIENNAKSAAAEQPRRKQKKSRRR
jgi:hypothetical protein